MNLRTIRTALYLGGFLLTTTPKRAKIRKIYETDPITACELSHGILKKAVRRILDISGCTVTVNGLDRIPDETCLFAGNHLSMFDVLVLEDVLPHSAGFVAKDSLEKIPGLSAWMSLIRCLFLNRKDTKEGLKTIFKGADYLKEGYSMVIFPEGTRYDEGHLGEFKGASLKMAQKAKVPVVPFALTGTSRALEDNNKLSIKPSEITLTFGNPLRINDLPRLEQKNAVSIVRNEIAGYIEDVLGYSPIDDTEPEE